MTTTTTATKDPFDPFEDFTWEEDDTSPETSRVEPNRLAPVKVGHSSEAGMPDIRVPSDVVVVPSEDEGQAAPVPSDWQWDPAKGLQSAKQWSTALMGCRCVTNTDKLLGWLLREHVVIGWGDNPGGQAVAPGCVALGEVKIMELTGWSRSRVYARRGKLRDAGWITATGSYFRNTQAKVYRLTIPACACMRHRPGMQDGATGDTVPEPRTVPESGLDTVPEREPTPSRNRDLHRPGM